MRIKERNHRVSRFYTLGIAAQVVYQRIKDPSPLHGAYILRTSRKDLSPDEIWNTYISLTREEHSFRCLKSDLVLIPVFYQIAPRCVGHIWITILAYHLPHFIQYKLHQQGDNRSWATLIRVLRPDQYCTIVLPTVEGSVISLRRDGIPDHDHDNRVSWPNDAFFDEIFYSTSDDHYIIVHHLRWFSHPSLVVVFDGPRLVEITTEPERLSINTFLDENYNSMAYLYKDKSLTKKDVYQLPVSLFRVIDRNDKSISFAGGNPDSSGSWEFWVPIEEVKCYGSECELGE